jgi:hypothetical protein
MLDLIGDEIKPQVISNAKRKPTVRKGYAATPGTGPQGETCGTCEHSVGRGSPGLKIFYKCELLRHCWTGGYGTDILLKSPACRYWEKEQG